MKKIDIYLEVGKKRIMACAIDWPGWCRVGRDEEAAQQSLIDYAPRYARVLQARSIPFDVPTTPAQFNIVERVEGNATTDFGAPDVPPSSDTAPVSESELERFLSLLEAGWHAFDQAMSAAEGKELRKGPRGGGRDLESIVRHVLDADYAYLRRLAWKFDKGPSDNLHEELAYCRQQIRDALPAAVRGETPKSGPRGGKVWEPRTFVRRSAWHTLDHLWEIEDRIS